MCKVGSCRTCTFFSVILTLMSMAAFLRGGWALGGGDKPEAVILVIAGAWLLTANVLSQIDCRLRRMSARLGE